MVTVLLFLSDCTNRRKVNRSKVVQNYLGHSTIAITLDLYTHVSDDKAHSEMEKLQQLYQIFES